MRDVRDRDAAVAEIAGRQRGYIGRDQLAEVGLGRRAIEYRVATKRLHRVFRGVYLVGHAVPPALAREGAAVFIAGEDALLSHTSAAALWGLFAERDNEIHVTAPRALRSRLGLRMHRTSELPAGQRRVRHNIPVTSAARALLDCTGVVSLAILERGMREAFFRGHATPSELRRLIANSHGRQTAPVKAIMAYEHGPAFTRSGGERELLRLIRAGGLPEPEVNVVVHGHELDFFWREQRLNLELDGKDAHRHRGVLDAVRDAELHGLLGIRVMRVTGRELARCPEGVLVRLARELAVSPCCAPRSVAGR